MKTSYYLCMFIVVATVSAIACSETDPLPDYNPGSSGNQGTQGNPGPSGNPGTSGNSGASGSQYQTREYHTWVTTWALAENNTYIGLVTQVPQFGYSKPTISVIIDGMTTLVDLFSPFTTPTIHSLQDDYIWATFQNNVLLLHFTCASPESIPPFPLEVVINY